MKENKIHCVCQQELPITIASQNVVAQVGTVVTQGCCSKGILQTGLKGLGTTTIVIESIPGIQFNDQTDLVIHNVTLDTAHFERSLLNAVAPLNAVQIIQ